MNRIRALSSCLGLAAMAVLLISCDGASTSATSSEGATKITSAIVGAWHNDKGTVEVTFHVDGTGTKKALSGGAVTYSAGFQYGIPSEGNLRITDDKTGSVDLLKYWLSGGGDSLTVVDPTSDTTKWTRGALSFSAVSVDTSVIPWNASVSYGNLKDVRDGKSYRTVKIGSQTWMAEDLAFETAGAYRSEFPVAWDYTWSAAYGIDTLADSASWAHTQTRRGVCPAGWHLPSLSEWNSLTSFVGGSSSAGSDLKSTSGWYHGGNGLDKWGFRVLSTSQHYDENDSLLGSSTLYWTSTDSSSTTYPRIAGFYSWKSSVDFGYGTRKSWYHVRCLQD